MYSEFSASITASHQMFISTIKLLQTKLVQV